MCDDVYGHNAPSYCDSSSKDVIGRIVNFPGFNNGGAVPTSVFSKAVRLVR